MSNRPGNDDRITTAGHSGESNAGGLGQQDAAGGIPRHNGGQSTSGSARARSNRGFASMDRGKQKEIASKGGKAAHAKGTAHEFDSGEAREAGRKGGVAVSRNREHMAAIGRRGGEARGHSRSRAVSSMNTGGATGQEGAYHNSRNSGATSDRQVAIDNQSDGLAASPTGGRGNAGSLGGERRPGSFGNDSNPRGESFGSR